MGKVDFSYCYGCGVCAVACPRNAIRMVVNDEGFLKPHIDSTCIDCGICLKVCSFCHDTHVKPHDLVSPVALAAWSKDKDTRYTCSSGGVAFEIGRYLISNGYKVIGCRYNPDKHIAEHYLASNVDDLRASIGSKYIQSETYSGFSQLKNKSKYLVVGTPCQIDSLRRFVQLRKMENDVILMDFFCHGVPSKLMWNKYLKELQQKIGDFDKIRWRDKQTGWHDSWVMKVDGKYSSWFSQGDLFYQMFLKDRCLGKACYHNCKYKYDKSAADIRIGDLWGKFYENNDEGVNGVICFTFKGKDLFNEMSKILHIEPSYLNIVGESQMKRCARKPISYGYVMRSLKSEKPLHQIHIISTYIERLESIPRKILYYIMRMPTKVGEIFNRNYQ